MFKTSSLQFFSFQQNYNRVFSLPKNHEDKIAYFLPFAHISLEQLLEETPFKNYIITIASKYE